MAGEREPRDRTIIFLDTQPIESEVFLLDGGNLADLRSEVGSRDMRIAVTEVQVHEIRAHLAEQIHDVRNVIRAMKADAGNRSIRRLKSDAMDTGIVIPRLFKHPNVTKALDEAVNQARETDAAFTRFLESSNVITVPCGEITASRLLTNYFGGIAPFGPGRKKDEFPDAIAIEALKDFARAHPFSNIVVVSGDPDWRKALGDDPMLQFCANVGEALQHLRNLDAIAALIRKLEAATESNAPQINDHLAEEFETLDFSLDEDWGADIEDVEVRSSEIKGLEVTSFREHIATVKFTSTIDFTCIARWPADDFTQWEQSYNHATIDTQANVTGAALITLSESDDAIEDIHDVAIEGPVQVAFADARKIRTKRWDDDDRHSAS